jgi:hypothetical protein
MSQLGGVISLAQDTPALAQASSRRVYCNFITANF